VADTVATNSEILYTDQGYADRYPAPAFSMGIDWQLREWLIGYDGAVWFSGQKSEGDALWFNKGFRVVLPSNETPTALAQMDSFMLIFTATSIWQIGAGGLPDDTGANGSIPTPVRLPFANGCTGFAKTIRNGVVYSSSAGGAWLITRDLQNGYLSGADEDDFGDANIRGITVNVDQRIGLLLSDDLTPDRGSVMAIWDSEATAWTVWDLPKVATTIATYHGDFVFADAETAPAVWVQVPDQYADDVAAIPLTVRIDQCDLAGVRNFKRCWTTQLYGQYRGDHNLQIDMFIDDNTTTPIASWTFTPTADEPYLWELAMPVELISNIGFEFRIVFPNGPSPGASLESLAFYVGVEKGLNKLAIARRIPSTG